MRFEEGASERKCRSLRDDKPKDDEKGLELAGEEDGHVVGLFAVADPVLEDLEGGGGEEWERELAASRDVVDEAGFAEFAGGVFWLGEAVGEGYEEIAGFELNGGLGVLQVFEEADDGAAYVETL